LAGEPKVFFRGSFASGAGPPRMRMQAPRSKRKEASNREPANSSPRCGSLLANKGPMIEVAGVIGGCQPSSAGDGKSALVPHHWEERA